MQTVDIQNIIKESLVEAVGKAGLICGNFLDEIEWLLKNVRTQNFEDFDKLVPVGKLSPEVQKVITAKDELVYIKPRVYAKIKGWWQVLKGHSEITDIHFSLLPYFLYYPGRIFQDKTYPNRFWFVSFLEYTLTLIVEIDKDAVEKNEIVTFFLVKEKQLKKMKKIWFGDKKMTPDGGTANSPYWPPEFLGVAGCSFSGLRQESQKNNTISVKKSQALEFYKNVNKETKVNLLYFPKKLTLDDIYLEHPADPAHGDYASNIAMVLAKEVGKNPMEIAKLIMQNIKCLPAQAGKISNVEKVEAAAPGFINFWLSKEFLFSQISARSILAEIPKTGKTYMVEFAHPNTLKSFHIGHLRNISIGESIVWLLESQGISVVRANYQGDVGLHVAKALWALGKVKSPAIGAGRGQLKVKSLNEKIEFLGKAYAEGNRVYEEGGKARKEIIELNKKIYGKNPEIMPLWQETRQWSLSYFEEIYQSVGTTFDRYYFESEVADLGKQIVLGFLKKGVFEESEGAVIFDGEKYGLHKRVFITKDGLPTYEAKDMGLARLQFSEYNLDKCIHVVGPEQKGYFEVVFKALELIQPKTKNKEEHLMYGWVRLKEGKMSSRAGEVVTASSLLNEIKKRVFPMIDVNKEYSEKEKEEIAEKVTIAAAKYSLLKFAPNTEIAFDIDESISLSGNSGPYLQYTYARTQSVLKRAKSKEQRAKIQIKIKKYQIQKEENDILRTLYKFPEVVADATENYAPNLICNFLFDLAQKFNTFYEKLPIIKADSDEARNLRFTLTTTTGQIIKDGLFLLGVEAPARM